MAVNDKPTIIRRRKAPPPPETKSERPALKDAPPAVAPPENPYLDREAMNLRDPNAKAGAAPERPKGVVPPRRNYALVDGIDPFELFAAYHLGLTADDRYQPQNIHDLSRRFRSSPERINEALKAYEIDADVMLCTDFDLAGAQIDIRLAPLGVSKREIARMHYEEFRTSPRFVRDWAEELRRDAAENEKIFGKR